jgi:hypothetical protein
MVLSSKRQKPKIGRLALLLAAIPSFACAQGAAPAMFGVEEVIVQIPHFGNDKTADECGLDPSELSDILEQTLQQNNVPAVSVAEAKPSVIGIARINLLPDVFSFNSQGLDCTSWVSLAAESRNSVRIPPVDTSRNVTISYWREGIMLASSQTTHERTVGEALRKLARQFATQYKLDQPPPVPKQ